MRSDNERPRAAARGVKPGTPVIIPSAMHANQHEFIENISTLLGGLYLIACAMNVLAAGYA